MRFEIENLRIVPLTEKYWPAFEELLGQTGPCSRCWCMYWRIGADYRRKPADANRDAFHAVVRKGPSPGLLAFHEKRAVGWCQLTPRHDLVWLDKARDLKPVDHQPVWSISCFYIRIGYRRCGITRALIDAAVDSARRSGARILEAYPLDADLTPSASSTGYATTFTRAGFKTVARHRASRPIMRIALDKEPATKKSARRVPGSSEL